VVRSRAPAARADGAAGRGVYLRDLLVVGV
jgi:hypothetical protein